MQRKDAPGPDPSGHGPSASLDYIGSVSIDAELLAAADVVVGNRLS